MNGTEFAAKRRTAGLKQEDIEAITGIAQTKISRFEVGTATLDDSEIERLAAALEYRQMLAIPRPVRIPAGEPLSPEQHP